MAYKYVDFVNGNDSTGDGSAGAPYKTITKAATVLATGNEIRLAGTQITAIADTYNFTHGSKSVTVSGDKTASWAAGDRIKPSRTDVWGNPYLRVSSAAFAGGVTTLTLTYNFIAQDEQNWSGAVKQIKSAAYGVLNADGSLNSRTFTITGGWKLTDETQPSDYITGASGGYSWRFLTSGTAYLPGASRIQLIGFISVFYNIMYLCLGTLELHACTKLEGYDGYIETILCQHTSGYDCLSSPVNTAIGRAWATLDANWQSSSQRFQATDIGELHLGGSTTRTVYLGGNIGTLNLHSDITVTPDSTYPTNIGAVVLNGHTLALGTPVSGSTPTSVGGPVTSWTRKTAVGVVDKTTGRGGTGYCLRMDPTQRYAPLRTGPIVTLVRSGQTVSISFWCYYGGTAGDAPACWVDLVEPNGVTVARQTFTPVRGTSWSDATQQTVNFTTATAQQGSLAIAISCCDNAAGDAILYVDDLAWTNAGDVAQTGDLETHGLVQHIQTVSSGGGLPFPLGL
jgi:hypothetical protein